MLKEGFNPTFGTDNPTDSPINFQIGFLVFYEKENLLVFRDTQEKDIGISRVLFIVKEWNRQGGEKHIPRPYIIGENKIIKERGENLLYTYVNSSDSRIVVFGVVADLTLNHLDYRLSTDVSKFGSLEEKCLSRDNTKRYYSLREDGVGNLFLHLYGKIAENAEDSGKGNVAIKISGTEGNGNLNIAINGKFIITQMQGNGKEETAIAQILMDNTNGAEKIKVIDKSKNKLEMNKDGIIIETTAIRIGNDKQTLKKLLDKLVNVITKMTQNTPAGPTVSPPLNIIEFNEWKEELSEFMDRQ